MSDDSDDSDFTLSIDEFDEFKDEFYSLIDTKLRRVLLEIEATGLRLDYRAFRRPEYDEAIESILELFYMYNIKKDSNKKH